MIIFGIAWPRALFSGRACSGVAKTALNSAQLSGVTQETTDMIIKSVRESNLRSLLEETLNCESLTALVGPVGAGKSPFLRALDIRNH